MLNDKIIINSLLDNNYSILNIYVININEETNFICQKCKFYLSFYIISINNIIITRCDNCSTFIFHTIPEFFNSIKKISNIQLYKDIYNNFNKNIKDELNNENINNFIAYEKMVVKIKEKITVFLNKINDKINK